MKNKLRNQVIIIFTIAIILCIALNISLNFVADRHFEGERDRVIGKGDNEWKKDALKDLDDAEFLTDIIINISILIVLCVIMIVFINDKTKYIKTISLGLVEIGGGNLKHRVVEKDDNELTELAEDINKTAMALEERFKHEKQLTQKERDLLQNISHDIRTPLSAILGYAYIIKDENKAIKNNQYIDIIINKSMMIKKIIEDCIDNKSSVKEDKIKLNKQKFCTKTVYAIEEELSFNEFNVEVDIKTNTDTQYLWYDGFGRVIENLVSNTIKYADKTRVISILLSEYEGNAKISIINGCTKATAVAAKKLTDKFYRVDSSRSLDEGSGLGLNICKNILESNGGGIEIIGDTRNCTLEVCVW